MKTPFRLAGLAVVLALAAVGAQTPAAAPATDSTDEAPQTDAQRVALEKNASDAARTAQAQIEKLNPQHLPAFPGAEGFGALATGGRGGEIVHVTNLNDAGPGSFREAVGKPNRIVVFDVGGVIKLGKEVTVSDNLTLLGQTAPGEGICFVDNSVSLSGHTNIIVRYLRFREGIKADAGKKSLGMDRSSNIIIDHCSIEWGRWDDLGITVGSTTITVQNCIVAEAIHQQCFGALIDTVTNVSLSHNLWMSNESRNPKVKGTIQYINNVVYNWGGTGLCGGHSAADHSLDVISNYFIKGPSSNNQYAGQFTKTDHVFQQDNLTDLDRDGKLNGVPVPVEGFTDKGGSPTFVSAAAMHPLIPVTTQTAEAAYRKIVADAGCALHRDATDLRLIDELTSLGTKGKTLPQEPKAPVGPNGKANKNDPVYVAANAKVIAIAQALCDTLGELKGGPVPQFPADGAKLAPSGYATIEVYANGLVAPSAAK